jgi:hypothetical protein
LESEVIMETKLFFIIEKYKSEYSERYSIHSDNMYDLTTAVKKLLALDTLNEDRERTSYHLQEVNFSMVDKPLVLTDEVKPNGEDKEQMDIPF